MGAPKGIEEVYMFILCSTWPFWGIRGKMGGGAGPGTDKGDGGQGVEDERGLRAGWVSWWVDQKGRRGSPETILREILHRCKKHTDDCLPDGLGPR